MIVVDFDGTLCNIDHRVQWAQAGEWDEFQSRLDDDHPYPEVSLALRVFGPKHEVIGLTGRDEKWRLKTQRWLEAHDLLVCFDEIIMRPTGNFTPDHKLKIKLLEDYCGGREATLKKVKIILDDRDKVVEAFRNYGLPCWQVRNGSY